MSYDSSSFRQFNFHFRLPPQNASSGSSIDFESSRSLVNGYQTLMRCTLIIPTYNRQDQFQRQLLHCTRWLQNFAIRVADGSNTAVSEANRAAVEACGHPDAQWRHFPDTHAWHRAMTLLEAPLTPYAMLCADDDFLMPNGVLAALDFLDQNPDYTTAQGITLGLPGPSANGVVTWHLNSLRGKLDAASPIERAAQHLAAYSHTCYAVHRAVELRESLKISSSTPFTMANWCLCELAQSLHSVLAGKAAWLDIPFLCRSPSTSTWPAAQQLAHPDFSACVSALRDHVVCYAAPGEDALAAQLFDHAFTSYFIRGNCSLTSSEFDFWQWRSPRTSMLDKPDLHQVLRQLKSSADWNGLASAYPPATTAKLKKRHVKTWLRSIKALWRK